MTETERIPNRTKQEHCRFCDDTAQVLYAVQEPPYGEEMAPCPWCESGLWLEFGRGRRWDDKKDQWVEYQTPHPPWGQAGFWRGREPIHD